MIEIPQYTLDELNEKTLGWSKDRGITVNGKSTTQGLKLVSEVGELCDNLAKGTSIIDDVGDCLVVLCNLAELEGITLEEAWSHSWNDIKDRKGALSKEGSFIKDTDPRYDEIVRSLENDSKYN